MVWLLLLLACTPEPAACDAAAPDCDDPACAAWCPATERCVPGEDGDGDGLSACDDPDCAAECQPPAEDCANEVDDDDDAAVDCDDPDCEAACLPVRPEEAVARFRRPELNGTEPLRFVVSGDRLLALGGSRSVYEIVGDGPSIQLATALSAPDGARVVDALPHRDDPDDLWLLLATPEPTLALVDRAGVVREAATFDGEATTTPVSMHRLADGRLAVLGAHAIPDSSAVQATVWILDEYFHVLRAARGGPWVTVTGATPVPDGLLMIGSAREPDSARDDPQWGLVGEDPAHDRVWLGASEPFRGQQERLESVTRLADGDVLIVGASTMKNHFVRLRPDGALRTWTTFDPLIDQVQVKRVVPLADGGWVALGNHGTPVDKRPFWLHFGADDSILDATRTNGPLNGIASDLYATPTRSLVITVAAQELQLSELGNTTQLTGACEPTLTPPPRGVSEPTAVTTTAPGWVWEPIRATLREVSLTLTTDPPGEPPVLRCP